MFLQVSRSSERCGDCVNCGGFCGCVTSCGIFAGSPSQSGHQETPTGEPKVAQPQHGSPLRGLSGEVATTNAKSTNHTPHGNHSRTQKNAPLKPAIRPAQEGRYSSLFNAYTVDRRAESAQSIGNFGWPRQVLSQPVRHSRGALPRAHYDPTTANLPASPLPK